MSEKARYWTGVLYPENMRSDWQEVIGDVLEYPCAYCIHDKDMLGEYEQKDGEEYQRKAHVHLMVAYGNTTTYNAALQLMSRLSADGKKCINTVQSVSNVRRMYDYLIHDTETAKKQKKYQYDSSERVCCNNFDIGAYEQLSVADKRQLLRNLCDLIRDNGIVNFMDLYDLVSTMDDTGYFEVMATYASFLEKLTKGNYQKWQMMHQSDE